MSDADFDLARAENTLMNAQAAVGKSSQYATGRLAIFGEVVSTLDGSLTEVKRLRITHVQALEAAHDDLRVLIAEQVRIDLERYVRLHNAFKDVHPHVPMRQREDGEFRWWPEDERKKEFSKAYDKLFAAHLAVLS